jgi:hypothetical protein
MAVGDGVGAIPAGTGAGVVVGDGAGAVGVSVSAGDGVVGASVGARSGLGRRITTIRGSIRTTLRQTWFTLTRPRMMGASEATWEWT